MRWNILGHDVDIPEGPPDPEPSLSNDELVMTRQLIEERFGDQTGDAQPLMPGFYPNRHGTRSNTGQWIAEDPVYEDLKGHLGLVNQDPITALASAGGAWIDAVCSPIYGIVHQVLEIVGVKPAAPEKVAPQES